MTPFLLSILVIIIFQGGKVTYFPSLCLGCNSYKEASRLYDVLMNQQRYNKIIRPVSKANDTLTVFFGLGLLQLMDVASYRILMYFH